MLTRGEASILDQELATYCYWVPIPDVNLCFDIEGLHNKSS